MLPLAAFPLLANLPGLVSGQTALTTVTIDAQRRHQTIDNFAASDAWYVEPLIQWPEAQRRRVADLLFSVDKGIGLSAWRFYIGGGINRETISHPFRTSDTFERAPGQYDWTACPGQRWMLDAARKRGVDQVIGFACSPPKRLTRNGRTNGTDKEGSTNLKPGAEAEFARYLADISAHFRFDFISPINEPDFEWNQGSQEGCRAGNEDLLKINVALHDELRRRNMAARILFAEATSPSRGYEASAGMARKYGQPYGDYAALLRANSDWVKSARPIYAYHSYWADGNEARVRDRERLRDAFRGLDVPFWQTEYCKLGEDGPGRDLGMGLALHTAGIIHRDLTIVGASAWQWWLAVSSEDYKDGLVYTSALGGKEGHVLASKNLWALGNYSRFVRPGWVRIEARAEGNQELLVSAYAAPIGGKRATVVINPTNEYQSVTLTGLGETAIPWVTSDEPGDDLRKGRPVRLTESVRLKPRSVTTFTTGS